MIRVYKSLYLLETRRTTYCFQVTRQGFLQHLYYGRRLDLSGGWDALVPQAGHHPGNGAVLDRRILQPGQSLRDALPAGGGRGARELFWLPSALQREPLRLRLRERL